MPKNKDLIQQSDTKKHLEKSDTKAFKLACTTLEEIKKRLMHCNDLDDLHTLQILNERVNSNSEAVARYITEHPSAQRKLSELESRVHILIEAKASELKFKELMPNDKEVFERTCDALNEIKTHLEICNDLEDLHTLRVINNRIDLECAPIIRYIVKDKSAHNQLMNLTATVARLMQLKTQELSPIPQKRIEIPAKDESHHLNDNSLSSLSRCGFFNEKAHANIASKRKSAEKAIIADQSLIRELKLG